MSDVTIDIGTRWSTGGRLTIGGVLLHVENAWNVKDCRDLWRPAAVRGQDIVVPHAVGTMAVRRRRTVTVLSLPFVIGGFADRFGVRAYGLEALTEQFEANMDYLRANVLDPTNAGDGTRSATLQMPSGANRTGDLHVLGLTPATWWDFGMTGTLDLSIPDGVLS